MLNKIVQKKKNKFEVIGFLGIGETEQKSNAKNLSQ